VSSDSGTAPASRETAPSAARRTLSVGAWLSGERVWPYLFVLPAVVLLVAIFGYPLVMVIRNSFYAGGVGQLSFNGVGNYVSLFDDGVFLKSLKNSLTLLICVPVTTLLALLIALMLYEGTRAWKAYRLIVFVPYMIPATAVGVTFSYLLQQHGIFNQILSDLHLGAFAQDWLGNVHIAIFSVGGVIIWTQLGFGVVVFTAALLSLPEEVSEAATVDGASRWQRNRYIIVPQIRGTLEFFIVIEAIQVLAWAFPYVYVMTQGGPNNATTVMDLYIYRYAFNYNSVGLSSSAAVVLLAMASVLIYFYSRARRRQEERL
jgi:ABC-type sugar transport system permease subunit